jgi:hypothetical protein
MSTKMKLMYLLVILVVIVASFSLVTAITTQTDYIFEFSTTAQTISSSNQTLMGDCVVSGTICTGG